MKDHPDERLDELLQRWAESRAANDEQITALRDRVLSTLDETPLVDVPPARRPRKDLTVAKRLAWFCAGAAAAVVFAFLVWPDPAPERHVVSPGTRTGASDREQDGPAFAALTKDQLRVKAILWKEMDNMFSGQLQWTAESNDKVAMGLLPEARSASHQGGAIAIRLVVVSRETDNRTWTPLWTVDVVTRGEEVVALTRECSGVGKLLLWTYPLADGMVAVDGRIALPEPMTLDSPFSGIQREGTTEAILSVDAGDVEYRVFQAIALVHERMG